MDDLLLGFAIAALIITVIFIIRKNASSNEPSETGISSQAEKNVEPKIDGIPLEVIAVITAAISAETGLPEDGFVVRSIRRVRPWNEASRREQQRRLM